MFSLFGDADQGTGDRASLRRLKLDNNIETT
jgi:hypothetical protein